MDANRIGDRGGNLVMARAAVRQAQIAAHYNEVQTQNTAQFLVDGKFYALAPVDNQAFGTGLAAVVGCNEFFVAMWVNNTNTIAYTRGALVDPADVGNVAVGRAVKVVPLPDLTSGNALLALVKIKVGTGVTFTPGTTALNATNVTATFYDTSVMPTQPDQS